MESNPSARLHAPAHEGGSGRFLSDGSSAGGNSDPGFVSRPIDKRGLSTASKYGCGWFRGNPPKAILRRHTKVLTYSSSGYRVLQAKTLSGWVKNVQTCWSSRSQKCIKTRNSGSEVVLKESPRERQAKPKREGPFFSDGKI